MTVLGCVFPSQCEYPASTGHPSSNGCSMDVQVLNSMDVPKYDLMSSFMNVQQ